MISQFYVIQSYEINNRIRQEIFQGSRNKKKKGKRPTSVENLNTKVSTIIKYFRRIP